MVVDLGLIGPQELSTTVGAGASNPLKLGETNTILCSNTKVGISFGIVSLIFWGTPSIARAHLPSALTSRKLWMVGPGNHGANCECHLLIFHKSTQLPTQVTMEVSGDMILEFVSLAKPTSLASGITFVCPPTSPAASKTFHNCSHLTHGFVKSVEGSVLDRATLFKDRKC